MENAHRKPGEIIAEKVKLSLRVTQEELDRIHERMAQAGVNNRESFMRRMILEGAIQPVNMKEIKKLNTLLGYYGNNLNQIARRFAGTGRLYEVDIQDIAKQFNDLVEQVKSLEDEIFKSTLGKCSK